MQRISVPCNLLYYLKEISQMALFQVLCSFLIQKGLYFQSKKPNFIPIGTEQQKILKLVQGFPYIPLGLISQLRFTGAIFLKKKITKN